MDEYLILSTDYSTFHLEPAEEGEIGVPVDPQTVQLYWETKQMIEDLNRRLMPYRKEMVRRQIIEEMEERRAGL